jgi:hypothetical protein
MFGGLAFLIDGHMAVAASGQGGLMLRVDPARRRARHGARTSDGSSCAAGRWTGGFGPIGRRWTPMSG